MEIYLFDLWIFLLRLSAQVAKIVLQGLEELLCEFSSSRTTSYE